jgi:hypothetical protein
MKLKVDNRGVLNTSLIVNAETDEILADVYKQDGAVWYLLCNGVTKRFASYDAAVAAGVKLLGGELT